MLVNVFILGTGCTRLSPPCSSDRYVSVIVNLDSKVEEIKLIMSASPVARQATHSQAIPSRRVLITDPAQMPDVYSSTPGGTLYSTTPGGRYIYPNIVLVKYFKASVIQVVY